MSSLLSRTPEEACRLIALSLLTRTENAAARLHDPQDDAALHDFRVSLRRLRSVLRAYREPLRPSVKKRHRRRLRDVGRATGPGRDAEVAAAWLRGQRERLDAGQQRGLDWLHERFEERRGAGTDEVRELLGRELEPLARELEERLGVYTREVRLDGASGRRTFGELVGEEAGRALDRLLQQLDRVESVDDGEAVHQARLASKRLRYLLEPLEPEMEAVVPILDRLEGLQDLLGELNDAYGLEGELSGAVERAARQRARSLLEHALETEGDEAADGGAGAAWRPVDGLLTLARRNRERRDRLYGELRERWLGEGEGGVERDELETAVRALLRWLDAGFSPPPPESAAHASAHAS